MKLKTVPNFTQLLRQYQKDYKYVGCADLKPSLPQRLRKASEVFDRIAVEFGLSKSDTQKIMTQYLNCIGDLYVALAHFNAGVAKDRKSGRIVDLILPFQGRIEYMASSGLMSISEEDLNTTKRVFKELTAAEFQLMHILTRYSRNGQFSTRPLHSVHKKTIDFLRKGQKLDFVFATVVEIHNAFLPEKKVTENTIKVEYHRAVRRMKSRQ